MTDPTPREVTQLLATLETDLAAWHTRGRSEVLHPASQTNEGEES